jgi:hypothetical protein
MVTGMKMAVFGMLHNSLVDTDILTDVSEELIASIIGVMSVFNSHS